MVLIISEDNDSITDKVIESLEVNGTSWVRINSSDHVELKYHDGEYYFRTAKYGKRFKLSQIKKFWYRRGFITIPMPLGVKNIIPKHLLSITIKDWQTIASHFLYCLENKCDKILGSFDMEINDNKLIDIEIAQRCGLKVPNFWIINNVSDYHSIHNTIITKTLNTPLNELFVKGRASTVFSTIIDENHIKKCGSEFFPSFVQQYVEKIIDIRIFFTGLTLHPIAIFSQNNVATIIDSRRQDLSNVCRHIPYILPNQIETAIKDFIASKKLTTGSIDLILSKENDYYFLEVNPSGQVDWLSNLCNLNIEKNIVDYLAS